MSIDRVPWLKALTVASLATGYLYFFPYFKHLGNPNENVRVFATVAIVEHGTFALNKVIPRFGPVDDRATNRGHRCAGQRGPEPCTYSSKAPGTSYLGVPIYLALHGIAKLTGSELDLPTIIYFLRLFAIILPSLLFLFAFYRFLGRYVKGDYERLIATATLGLGTMSFTYAHLFAGHQLVALLTFGSFMLIERAHHRGQRWPLVFAGGFAFFAAITEYPALLAAIALGAYALVRLRGRRWWALGLFAGGALLPVFLVLFYHQVCFDSPWKTGYSMLANRAYAGFHSTGVFGISWPKLQPAYESLFSPRRGLFFFSPFLLLAFPGMVALWRRHYRAEFSLVAFVVVFYLVYQSAVNPDIGGWSIGPRYIVIVTPFLAFGAAIFLETVRWRSSLYLHLLATPLALLSIGLTFVSTVIYHTFPPAFANPFFEFVIPLWRYDFFNHSIGTFAGLRGLWSALPGLLPVAGLGVALCAGPRGHSPESRALLGAVSALVVAGAVSGIAHLQRQDTPQVRHEFQRHTQRWEPKPVGATVLREAMARVRSAPNDVQARLRLARLLARLARGPAAAQTYAEAWRILRRRPTGR